MAVKGASHSFYSLPSSAPIFPVIPQACQPTHRQGWLQRLAAATGERGRGRRGLRYKAISIRGIDSLVQPIYLKAEVIGALPAARPFMTSTPQNSQLCTTIRNQHQEILAICKQKPCYELQSSMASTLSLSLSLLSSSYLFKNLVKYCDTETLKTVYHSYFESKIKYGILSWGVTKKQNITSILKCQKRILRIINKAQFLDSCSHFQETWATICTWSHYKRSLPPNQG